MLISVAICTWNRDVLLDQTLAEMRNLRVPEGVDWELLVVNNNCADNTDRVLANHADRLPLRRLFEPKLGQTNARNCAIHAAKGDYILWTDDDVLVSHGWIAAYAKAFRSHPEAAVFGSDITPWFEGQPPHWLLSSWQRVSAAYATREFGNTSAAITEFLLPFGANFSIRTAEQRRYLFDPDLGLRGNNLLRGDETTLILKMLRDGVQGRWVPDAPVRHYIPRDRQTLTYLRKYYFGQGQCESRMEPTESVAMLFGKPRYLWRAALTHEVRYRVYRLLQRPSVYLADLMRASRCWGQLFDRPDA